MNHVLHIIDHNGLGGAQTIVKGIVEQNPDTHHVYFLNTKDHAIEIHSTHITRNQCARWDIFSHIRFIQSYIVTHDITVIHCHLSFANAIGIFLKRIFFPHITLVIHEHGKIFQQDKPYTRLLKQFSQQIDSVIAISQATADHLQTKTGISPSKIKLLYNFVDLERFNLDNVAPIPELRAQYDVPLDSFVVGFAGRLTKRKGWREFVQASLILTRTHPNLHFVIAGDGEDKQDLLMLTQDNPQIQYVGYVSDMPAFYAMLDCFVIPSHWEPMGLTEIEAQAMGVPVISANVSALNEIIQDGENGLLFEAGNSNDLSQKIQQIQEDVPLRKNLISKSSKTSQNYSLQRYIQNLQNLYVLDK